MKDPLICAGSVKPKHPNKGGGPKNRRCFVMEWKPIHFRKVDTYYLFISALSVTVKVDPHSEYFIDGCRMEVYANSTLLCSAETGSCYEMAESTLY